MYAPPLPQPAGDQELQPIRSSAELLSPFLIAERPRRLWQVGVEWEKFGVSVPEMAPVGYWGPRGIEGLFYEFEQRGWQPVREARHLPVIALQKPGRSITLEPGAQLELSGAPFDDVHGVARQFEEHHQELREISEPLGLSWLSVGFHPLFERSLLPWVPKRRYAIMRKYLPGQGQGALDMMQRTATIQVNLDFDSETDAMRKLTALLRMAPIVHAMTAYSPLAEGRLWPTASLRGEVWLHMDPSRSGLIERLWSKRLPAYTDYVDFALKAPMFLFKRGTRSIANTGQPFEDFLANGYRGFRATLADWKLHLNTLFPEARLKNTIEMRCCDAQSSDLAMAIPALLTGLMYDQRALEEVHGLLSGLEFSAVQAARGDLARLGLRANLGSHSVLRLAMELLAIAEGGLLRRGRLDANLWDERRYLEPLVRLVEHGVTPADRLRQRLSRVGPEPLGIIEELKVA